MNLSERLEAACTGVLVAEATGDLDIVTDAVNKLLDAAREAAELARRVEGAEVAHVEPKNGTAVLHERCLPLAMIGQRVRIVPEAGQGGGGG